MLVSWRARGTQGELTGSASTPLCMVVCSAVAEVVGWLRLRTVKLSRSWIVFQNKIGLGWREKANIV